MQEIIQHYKLSDTSVRFFIKYMRQAGSTLNFSRFIKLCHKYKIKHMDHRSLRK